MTTTTTQDWAPSDPMPPSLNRLSTPKPLTGWQIPIHSTTMDNMQEVRIPRQTLEKIYLNPPIDVKGDFRNILANPTPLGLVGFLVATLPMALQLMGLREGGEGGTATVAFSLFFGGMLQLLACLMEWILGNTFSFLVFGSFGAAWTALSCTNLPAFDAMGAYTAGAKTAAEVASGQRAFQCDFAYGIITFGLLILTFAFCALRTNIIFVITFLVADVAIFLLAASYWSSGVGAMDTAHELQKASGGMLFICCVLAWYLLVANLLEVLEFGWSLPVGDLSGKMGRQMGKGEYRDRSRSV